MPEGGTPPTEFRIWKWGENKTQRGSVVLDKESAAAVLESFSSHGIDLAIDYEHQTFNAEENGKAAPAAGWFKPEVRDDGLWAASVQWTDRAAEMLKSREYRYFSPTALLDSKTRKPVRLMPMALTNWPATTGITPLVARADEPSTEINMKTVLLALGLKAEADEAEAFAAANKLRELEREIISLSGAKSAAEAMGAIMALKSKAEKADALEGEIAKLKAAHAAAEVTSLLDEAVKDGRVTPAKRGEFEALHAKHGVDALRTCLSMLPKAAAPAVPPVDAAPSAAASGDLTPDQLRILKLTGMTPEKFAEHKKVLASLTNPTEEN